MVTASFLVQLGVTNVGLSSDLANLAFPLFLILRFFLNRQVRYMSQQDESFYEQLLAFYTWFCI